MNCPKCGGPCDLKYSSGQVATAVLLFPFGGLMALAGGKKYTCRSCGYRFEAHPSLTCPQCGNEAQYVERGWDEFLSCARTYKCVSCGFAFKSGSE